MANWINDPQNRPEVEKVTKNLKLPVWRAWHKGKFRDFWNECWGKIEDKYDEQEKKLEKLNKEEIEQILGFNVLDQEFILATLDDIKNLFPGSGGTSGAFDLGHISSDETKIVNMLLLNNYNEYLQQKILQIKDFFNSLNNNKADKTIRVDVGDGLLGSGTLESNINITVDKLNVTEIQNLLNNWR